MTTPASSPTGEAAISAGAACVAGAAHGLCGSPWLAFVMASGSAVALLSADRATARAAALRVLDSLAAVAIYRAVRAASCRPPAPTQTLLPQTPARPWNPRVTPPAALHWPTAPIAPAELAERELSPEHQEALELFQRGGGNPVSARRNAQHLLAVIAQEATVPVDLAHVQALRARLADVREGLRRVQLVEEATAFSAWNRASLSAREHRLCRGAGPSDCSTWAKDNQHTAEVEELLDAAERRALVAAKDAR